MNLFTSNSSWNGRNPFFNIKKTNQLATQAIHLSTDKNKFVNCYMLKNVQFGDTKIRQYRINQYYKLIDFFDWSKNSLTL